MEAERDTPQPTGAAQRVQRELFAAVLQGACVDDRMQPSAADGGPMMALCSSPSDRPLS
jgi:hypothetical protein|eukprot:COSAG01_NODE_4248_length_5208_cov_15.724408_2_plen_59_part_00